MRHKQCTNLFMLAVLLVCASGATCIRRNNISEFQPPIVFQETPSVDQIAEFLNRSRNIQEIQSRAVTVRIPDVPGLSANLIWQRSRNFRVQGGLSKMLGTDFDIGSNDELFWMATRHGPSPTMFVAQHQEFDAQLNRQVLPVSPVWLVEALGILELDPSLVLREPQMRPDGTLEILSQVPTAGGMYQRTLVLDPQRGVSRQIILRDPTGRLLAQATQSNHYYYESVQYALPHQVNVQLIPVDGPPLELAFEVAYYAVNANEGNDASRFVLPDLEGYTVINLVQLNSGLDQAAQPQAYQPAEPQPPMVGYRGFENQDFSIR
jgi:hypothetical protein